MPSMYGKMGMSLTTAVVFFNVSGGPMSSEEVVSSFGPLVGIGVLLAFAVFISIPQCL